MNPVFHVIDRVNWERSAYFDYYYSQVKCKYNLSANIDITELIKMKTGKSMKFFPMMLYVIMKAVNQNKEFRMSFNDKGELGYWDEVVPCYTLFHDENKSFTDIWSEYDKDFNIFYNTVLEDIEKYKSITGVIKARPNQPKKFLSGIMFALAEFYKLRTRYIH